MKFATKAIHAGQEPDLSTGAVMPPIFQTTIFAQQGLGEQKGYVYSRVSNPTQRMLEECLASLENGKYGLAFASGMAAESAVLGLLNAGDHIVACDDLYGDTYRLFERACDRRRQRGRGEYRRV
jgi:cystathionine gamma-lyase